MRYLISEFFAAFIDEDRDWHFNIELEPNTQVLLESKGAIDFYLISRIMNYFLYFNIDYFPILVTEFSKFKHFENRGGLFLDHYNNVYEADELRNKKLVVKKKRIINHRIESAKLPFRDQLYWQKPIVKKIPIEVEVVEKELVGKKPFHDFFFRYKAKSKSRESPYTDPNDLPIRPYYEVSYELNRHEA